MRKYVTRARWINELEEEVSDPPALLVFEEDGPVPTGLFDSQGNELFRVNEKEPIGYKVK